MKEAAGVALGCLVWIAILAIIMAVPWTRVTHALSNAFVIAAIVVLGALGLGAVIGLVRVTARWGK